MGKDTSGPAFPSQELDGQGCPRTELHPGMTLRQWYAGMAMQGFLSDPNYCPDPKSTAMDAFNIADAMLAQEKRDAEGRS